MKRIGRQFMALGVLAIVVLIAVSASGPGPELRQQIGVVGGLGILAFGGGLLLWLLGVVTGSEGKRAATPVKIEGLQAGPPTTEPTGMLTRAPRAPLISRALPGGYDVQIVGESHYTAALDAVATGQHTTTWADLIVEDDNPYDRNAVRVEIDGMKVGYLSKEMAPLVRPALLRLRERGLMGRAAATINGNRREQIFGVTLDLASPDDLLRAANADLAADVGSG